MTYVKRKHGIWALCLPPDEERDDQNANGDRSDDSRLAPLCRRCLASRKCEGNERKGDYGAQKRDSNDIQLPEDHFDKGKAAEHFEWRLGDLEDAGLFRSAVQ